MKEEEDTRRWTLWENRKTCRRVIKERTVLNKINITRDAYDGKKGHSIDNPYAQDYTLEKHTQQTEQSI